MQLAPIEPTRHTSIPASYAPERRFEVGDSVYHGDFGRGIVLGTLAGLRMEVLFASGRRVLPHARGYDAW